MYVKACKGTQLKRGSVITTQENNNAKQMLIKAQQSYASKLEYLKQDFKCKHPSLIHQLGLFLDKDDVIWCQGQIEYSNLSFDTTYILSCYLKKVTYLN